MKYFLCIKFSLSISVEVIITKMLATRHIITVQPYTKRNTTKLCTYPMYKKEKWLELTFKGIQ